jgi:hypothetical protein
MAYPPSSYGERPPLQGYRRSFTLPSRQLSVHERAGLDKSDADADVLFTHPNARIIAFSGPTDLPQSQNKQTLPDADYPIDTVETLPWRSRTETLSSTGAIKIEKVRGSSHFLKSADQKVIHTIMRNSQCWCVDGESKFVLRRAKLKYYRIELPTETDEDKQKVEEFKTALGKVLRFECTPCPFKRAFHVDLPEDAITPRRKGTWKRKPLQPATPNTDPLPLRRAKDSRAWSFQAQNDPSPLQSYGRRGSDYGFSTSRGSSVSRQGAHEYRSSTPSSVISSEDAYERQHDDGYSEDGQPEDRSDLSPSRAAPSHDASLAGATAEPEADNVKEVDTQEKTLEPTECAGELLAQSKDSIPRHENVEDLPSEQLLAVDDSTATVSETVNLQSHSAESEQETTLPLEVSPEHPASIPEAHSLEPADSGVQSGSGPDVQLDGPAQVIEDSASVHSEQTSAITQISETDPTAEAVETIQQDSSVPLPVQPDVRPEESEFESRLVHEQDDDVLSRVSSIDSFHTTDSLAQDVEEEQVSAIDFQNSQDQETFTPFFLNRGQHQRGLSEMTITASTVASDHSPSKQRPSTSDSTPGLAKSSASDSSWPEVHTPPVSPIKENLRRRLQAKRSLSPLPPPTTLYSPTPSPAYHGSPFTAQFLQKAANVALVKPIEAVALLVHILARIAGGATLNDLFSGELFRRPSDREQGVHRRRTSFPDQHAPPRDDSEEEDDFGVPIRGRTRSVEATASFPRSSAREDQRQGDQDSIFDLD